MLRLSAALCAACLLLGPPHAQAQAQSQATAEYDRAIRAAVAEFDAGNFSEARALFQRAHGLSPSARTLRGLGISAAELRLYVEAVVELQAALQHGTRPLTDTQRAEVEEALQRARLSVARIALTTDPPDAAVQIDGRAVALHDGELRLNPGEYTLSVTAPGYAPLTRSVRANSGAQALSLVLVAKPPGGDAIAAAGEGGEQSSPGLTFEAEADSLPVLFWVAAAGAVAFGGAALATHLVAGGEANTIEEDCPVEPMRVCSRADIDRRIDDAGIPTLNVLTGVAIGLAAASAIAAGLVIVLHEPSDAQPVSVAVSPQGATFAVRF